MPQKSFFWSSFIQIQLISSWIGIQLFDILVRPSAPGAASELAKPPCRYDDALMGGVRGGEFSTLFSTLVRAQLAALVTTQQSQDGKIGNKHSRFQVDSEIEILLALPVCHLSDVLVMSSTADTVENWS